MRETKTLILERIANGPTTWTEILELTRITKPALYQHLQELQEKGLITKDDEGKYILTREGQLALTQAKGAKARSSLFGIFKKPFIKEPELSLEEEMMLKDILSRCAVLPTLDQLVEGMMMEIEKLQNVSTSGDSKLYELSQDYAFAFLSFAEEVDQLRTYAFLKLAEVYGGNKEAQELSKSIEKRLPANARALDALISLVMSIIKAMNPTLEQIKEYKNLEPVYRFISHKKQMIEISHKYFGEVRAKFDQEVEAMKQKQQAKSQGNADPSLS